MERIKAFLRRLLGLEEPGATARIEREIDEELSFHLDMRTRDNIAGGMEPEEARRRAQERLGELDTVRRKGSAIRSGGRRAGFVARLADDLQQDLRFALRGMLRAPGFPAVAIIALTLGIGATTAVFSVVDGVLLEAFPYTEPDRLVTVTGAGVMPETREALRHLDALEDATFFSISSPEMVGPQGAVRGGALLVDERFFAVLGVRTPRGRTLVADDYRRDAAPVAVITDRLSRRSLQAREEAVGSTLLLNGVPHEIVGVLPPGVTMLLYEDRDIFKPLPPDEDSLMMVGRLRPGVTVEQGREQALALAATFRLDEGLAALGRLAELPEGQPPIYIYTLYEQVLGADRGGLLLLAGAVSLVLLIASANVANLSLARALSRKGEMAVRTQSVPAAGGSSGSFWPKAVCSRSAVGCSVRCWRCGPFPCCCR